MAIRKAARERASMLNRFVRVEPTVFLSAGSSATGEDISLTERARRGELFFMDRDGAAEAAGFQGKTQGIGKEGGFLSAGAEETTAGGIPRRTMPNFQLV